MVKKAFSEGALILTEINGDELSSPISSDAVKKYYGQIGVSKEKMKKESKLKIQKGWIGFNEGYTS